MAGDGSAGEAEAAKTDISVSRETFVMRCSIVFSVRKRILSDVIRSGNIPPQTVG